MFIAHDLAMVEYLCDRVGVMYRGRLVELAGGKDLFANRVNGYTRTLLSAIPIPDPIRERNRKLVIYDESDFGEGEMKEISPGHFVLKPYKGER